MCPPAEAWFNRLSVAIRMHMRTYRDVLQYANVRRALQGQAVQSVN